VISKPVLDSFENLNDRPELKIAASIAGKKRLTGNISSRGLRSHHMSKLSPPMILKSTKLEKESLSDEVRLGVSRGYPRFYWFHRATYFQI
jgi:hypothetical protein